MTGLRSGSGSGAAGRVLVDEAAEDAEEYETDPAKLLWRLTAPSIGGGEGR